MLKRNNAYEEEIKTLEDLKAFHEKNPEAISALKMAISLMKQHGPNTIVTKTSEEAQRVRDAFYGKRELTPEQRNRLREASNKLDGLFNNSIEVTINKPTPWAMAPEDVE